MPVEWSDEHQDWVNVVDDTNVLVHLVQYRQIERIQALIEKGYNLDTADEDGATGAYMAAKINDLELLKMLANAGADLGASCAAGLTPLFWAKDNKNEEMIEFITRWLAGVRDRPPGR